MTNEEDLYKNFNKNKGDFVLLAPKYEKTLRDEFAMAALTGALNKYNAIDEKYLPKLAYRLADEMLEARKAKGE